MRLAILSDIHGNLLAFEAALRHIAQHGVDLIIVTGDIVVGSPDSSQCWELAKSLNCPIVRGNHERYVAHFGTDEASPLWSTRQFAVLHFALAQLTEAQRKEMEELPHSFRDPGLPELYVVHASERSDHDTVASHTPEEELRNMFPTARERFIIRSHNHFGQVRLWKNGTIVTNSSVGLPLDSNTTAQYLLLDRVKDSWHFAHQSVPYDVDAAIKRFHDTGYLKNTGPVGRLFLRELATGTMQILPFIRHYAKWQEEGSISLDEAVERFLNCY